MPKSSKLNQLQAAATKDVLITDMDAVYEANLREYAQGVVPDLIEGPLLNMAKGTKWIYDDKGKVELVEGLKQYTGEFFDKSLQRKAILDLVEMAKEPAPRSALDQLASQATRGGRGIHITITQFKPKDEPETLEEVLEQAIDVTPAKEDDGEE
jgi:hypothetical protein